MVCAPPRDFLSLFSYHKLITEVILKVKQKVKSTCLIVCSVFVSVSGMGGAAIAPPSSLVDRDGKSDKSDVYLLK